MEEYENILLCFLRKAAQGEALGGEELALLPQAAEALEPSMRAEGELNRLLVQLIRGGLSKELPIPAEVLGKLMQIASKSFY